MKRIAWFILLSFVVPFLGSSCQLFESRDTTGPSALEGDPFFQTKPAEDEVFRILITEEEYVVK
ncbi:MAG: hypothetical protein KDK25_07900, partial [Leptospiraceae bacterium]|nr:hypothetical protein [Leptospiraceae bacterium]